MELRLTGRRAADRGAPTTASPTTASPTTPPEASKPSLSALDHSTQLAVERTRLAHDRNMMSWIRTAASLITFGFSVDQFFALTHSEHLTHRYLFTPRQFAIFLISIGLTSLLLATLDHRRSLKLLITHYRVEQSPRTAAGVVAALIALLGICTLLVSLLHG